MAPRTTWKGTLQVGLLNIPIGFVKAYDTSGVAFKHVTANGDPVGNKNYNKTTGEEVAFSDIKKAALAVDGTQVILEKDEIANLSAEKSKVLLIDKFVDASEIDFAYIVEPNYVIPIDNGATAFAALEKALAETGKAAIGNYVVLGKTKYVVLYVTGSSLVAATLRYGSDVRPKPEVDLPEANDQYVKLTKQLINVLSGEFDPADYEDEFKKEVLDLIESKAAGLPTPASVAPAANAGLDNLFAALEASILEAEKKSGAKKSKKSKVTV